MNMYKGKNNLLRRGVLVLGELVDVRMEWILPKMCPLSTVVASPIYRGPGPLPNIEQEGSQQRPI